jgi:NAD(P)-dependent dehydrogenase (short-subunit alcohol dehydrogenase family)
MSNSSGDATAARQVLLVGASSVIAHSLADLYARDGWSVILAGRNKAELELAAADIAIRRRARAVVLLLDANDPISVDRAAADLIAAGPLPHDFVFVIGYSDDPARGVRDPDHADRLLSANYTGVTRFLARLLPHLEAANGRRIAFVSSVAGDRGRQANFVYGAAKAALNAYAQGLRALLLPEGICVLTVKLGYVDTRSAYGKASPFLTCSPEYAARGIRRALDRGKLVVYLPWIWRPIMILLRLIPERIFIRLPLP